MRFAAATTALAISLMPASISSASPVPCGTWTMSTVAEGLGRIENLEPDGTGGMLISVGERSAVERVTPDGKSKTAVPNMNGPGGLRVRGGRLFAVTGTSIGDGVTGDANGTVEKVNLKTGKRLTYSFPLTAPNGLVFEADGDAYVSRDAGSLPDVPNPFSGGIGESTITRIPANDPLNPDPNWAPLSDTNGLAVDKKWLYASTTFNFNAEVYRIKLDDPSVIKKVAELGSITDPINGLDDMTMGKDGNLYIAANGMGRIWRLDPKSGDRCIIASGLSNPTSAKFGRGLGWPASHLFVSGWDGRIRELTPPK